MEADNQTTSKHMSKVFKFVNGCGKSNRTIFRIGRQVHIGCFRGSYKEAEAAIKKQYNGHHLLGHYLTALEYLKKGGEQDWTKFPWDEHSDLVVLHKPEKIDKERLNWREAAKAKYFDWQNLSSSVAYYAPHLIDPKKFNWARSSWAVAKFCPHHLDPELFDWETYSSYVAKHCPDRLDPKRYNWAECAKDVAKYCPELLKHCPKEHLPTRRQLMWVRCPEEFIPKNHQ